MNLIQGDDRRESIFFPQCLDDYIDSNSEVRIIDQFVDSLNLRECGFLFSKEDPLGRGRAAYDPADLLKLFMVISMVFALAVNLRKTAILISKSFACLSA